MIAGSAQLLVAAVGTIGYPYLHDVLIAIGYGLLLPGIAVLHVRHAAVRDSGAILATIAGAAVATVGIAGSANVDVRPAALFVLVVWWWTIGKLWAETGVLPRAFGLVTAALAIVTLVLVPLEVTLGEKVFTAGHAILGSWLLGLAVVLWRDATAA